MILLVGGATAAALALGGLVGGVLAESKGSPTPTAAPVALADRALGGAAAGIGASATRTLEARVRAKPEDADALTDLGFAYQLRWRETADASYLPRSDEALRRAVRFGTDEPARRRFDGRGGGAEADAAHRPRRGQCGEAFE